MQDVDQQYTPGTKGFLAAAAAVVIGLHAGCAGTRSYNDARMTDGSLPAWVQGMREPLQEFPGADAEHVPPADGVRLRVGEPRELGGVLTNGSSQKRSETGSRSSTNGSRANAVATIDINVNGLFDANQPGALEAGALEADTREPSLLELQYRGDRPKRPDRDLEQFGYAQLRQIAESAAGGQASADHVLSAGDEVVIDLTTDKVQRLRPMVDDDGMLQLEGIGAARVGGLAFDDARAAIRDEIARVRQGFELSIGLGRLAGVPIRVTGSVRQPGVVDAGPRPTLLDVLSAAEVRRSGSLRTIVIDRRTGERETIDLYGFLLGRTAPPDIRLSRGDSVVVPPIGRSVAVAGSVQRPGIYELQGDGAMSAADLIELAGGGTGFAIVEQIQIERTDNGRRVLLDVETEDLDQPLRNGDLLLVGAVDGRLHPVVEVRGEIANPGRFQYRQGLTTGDLVRLAGGLTVDAYEGEAIISRLMGTASRRASAWDGGPELTSRRVVIVDIGRALAGDPEHDVALEPLDLLRIRRFDEARETPTVELIGGARRPGTYELTAGLTVADLIALGGHLAPDAFREEAELVRRRRSDDSTVLDVDRYRLPLADILAGSSRGPVLENGDRLILRTLGRAEVRVSAEGMLRFPGEYVLPAGSTVTDLIAAAGGVLQGGDLRAARFTRESVRDLQASRWNELTERTRQTFERNLERRINSARTKEQFSARVQLQQAQATLDRLRGTQAVGRIALELTVPDFPTSEGNLPLETGDALFVPRFSNTVTVQGHVFNPLTVVYEQGISADDLLSRAGGSTELADEDRVYVIRADGRVASVEQRGGAFRLDDPMLPGDVLLVPPRPLGRDATSVALDLLLLARAAGEAGALWNLATGSIEDGSISIVDTPASPRSDSTPPAELLEEFQR